jgi:hypothetical protein
MPDDFEVSQTEKPFNVFYSQPVLPQGRRGQIQPLSQDQRQLPQAAVCIDNDSCPSSRKSRNILENGLYVPEIVNYVREDDHIKFLIKAKVVGVALNEMEFWMSLSGAFNHLAREIYSNPQRWFKLGKQITSVATDLQHSLASWDQELINLS